MDKNILDVRGLSCPEPVIRTKRELEKYNEPFEVLIDQEVAKENVSRLVKNMGYDIIVEEKNEEYVLLVKKG